MSACRRARLVPARRGPPRPAAAGPVTTSSRCSRWRSPSSMSEGTTAPAWRTCPSGWASPNPRSTTTWTARKNCSRWPWTGRWTACSRWRPTSRRATEPAIERLERLVRGSVAVLAGRLPYVTLLLRARGNTATERKALARRREFDQIVADLVKQAERDGDIRPDVDPAVTARLLFGLVNSLVEWYRPPARGASAGGSEALADAVCAVAFDGLRTHRRPPTDERADLRLSAANPPVAAGRRFVRVRTRRSRAGARSHPRTGTRPARPNRHWPPPARVSSRRIAPSSPRG